MTAVPDVHVDFPDVEVFLLAPQQQLFVTRRMLTQTAACSYTGRQSVRVERASSLSPDPKLWVPAATEAVDKVSARHFRDDGCLTRAVRTQGDRKENSLSESPLVGQLHVLRRC